MKATNLLMDEHRVIERVLHSLEVAAHRLESGQPVRPEFLLAAADFIRGFADGCHHHKEEGVLFVHMQDQGMEVEGCPLGVMYAEHALARQYTRALITAAEDMRAGDPSANRRAIQSSRSYIALLRQHIFKEDNILFPLAERVIPAEAHATVWEGFEHVEQAENGAGTHAKYLALAQALEREMSV